MRRSYFFDYPSWPSVADKTGLVWDGDAGADADIEILNTPANPAGEIRTALVQNKSRVICDLVFDWPTYKTGGGHVATDYCDIAIYSQSKHTGHAGSRFGWALIKDRRVWEAAAHYIQDTTMGISVDTQVRANTLMQHILSHSDDMDGGFYGASAPFLAARWAQVSSAVLPCGDNIVLQNVKSQGPSMWFKVPDGHNASAMLAKVGLLGIPGPRFGSSASFVRLNMLDTDSTFDLIVRRLSVLCDLCGVRALAASEDVDGAFLPRPEPSCVVPKVSAEGLAWETHLNNNRRLWRLRVA